MTTDRQAQRGAYVMSGYEPDQPQITQRHVVMFSSGAGSWAAARRVMDANDMDDVWLVFSDVSMEDEDNYRCRTSSR